MPGTVLLLAASPVGKSCLVDAASVLPVLAAVPPAVLAGTDTANVVELADPLEPQAVLTRLRAVAATPGPLTVFVAGQLALDRRQHLPHLALARTTPATVRYTALPWQWIREEFRLRSPGSTTLFLDLHADAEAWGWLRTHALDSGRNNAVFGRIAPPPSRRRVAGPSYMKTIATILRSGWRPPVEQLHQQAFTRLGPEAYGDVVLTVPPAPVAVPGGFAPRPPYRPERPRPHTPAGPVGADQVPQAPAASPPQPQDPHVQVTAAVQAGRHQDADALALTHEQAASRSHGPASEQALHWSEVRADLAMFARDSARSCRIWLTVAETRLAAGQAPDSSAVEKAVDRAHHQWGQVRDKARAQELGVLLAQLRARVPGRRPGALENVQKQLRELQATPF
ncbi:hypothetical protein [Streptomyces griseorubiginosus]|uniref:hypothetical protein n=1 Tax=Streptomyces griseorubiginosus TaxID=67304 RepID=UPI002E823F31|nr:hypothetical protein [Streptomyces griseorubiginosus]WUB45677.1 hypothetical protein OHN19_20900 [Streptomyces griseorubiginosus]WUB54195.1 hypothetical protein OG942_20900 [Streptomyces griseorubiginosus]